MTVTTTDLITWCRWVLRTLGYASTDAHLVGPLAWAYAEGGWSANAATYNCWNTTLPAPGSRPINSVGVQAYPTGPVGINATVATLRNGHYPNVLIELASGTAIGLANMVGRSPWGTSAAGILTCIPRAQATLAVSPPSPPSPSIPSEIQEIINMATSTPGFAVRFLYRFCLYREADEAGFAAQVNALNGGATVTSIMAGLQDSTEGQAAIAAQRKTLGLG